jgi:hypothetical protein
MAEAHIGFVDFARRVIDALEAADVTYLIGGAVAVWAWGKPRTTQDADDAFRHSALSRRQLVDLGPPLGHVFVHAPEDLILNKTAYYATSRQTKHVRDIASILATLDQAELDWSYLTAFCAAN